MEETIFHKIVKGEIPSFKIYEDEDFLAFLDIFPKAKHQFLVIPKQFQPSEFEEIEPETLAKGIKLANKIAKNLKNNVPEITRCFQVVEGMDVQYAHIKILPRRNEKNLEEILNKQPSKQMSQDEATEVLKDFN